jgi:hypothetical protein
MKLILLWLFGVPAAVGTMFLVSPDGADHAGPVGRDVPAAMHDSAVGHSATL